MRRILALLNSRSVCSRRRKIAVPPAEVNREALLDLFKEVVETPGVEQHILSHCTIAPAVVYPWYLLIVLPFFINKTSREWTIC